MLFTCCPNDVALKIARQVVHKKLAACVNIVPGIQSVYRWHDAIEEAKEVLLMIKTTQACYKALEEEISQHHPYELPEILAVPVAQCSEAYLQWLNKACTTT